MKRLHVRDELGAWVGAPNPRTGDRWTASSLRRAWDRACRAVGVRISIYEGTKHTFAKDAAARGVPE